MRRLTTRRVGSRAGVAAAAAAAALSVAVLGGSTPAALAEPGAEPGLPYLRCPSPPSDAPPGTADSCNSSDDYVNNGAWLNFPQVGMAGSTKSKQWARIPLSMMAANIIFFYYNRPGSDVPGQKVENEFWYDIRAFFVSPQGSDRNYGDSALIPVRTVAFGSVPVEATLQVSQKRDARGLPVPLRLKPHDYKVVPPDSNFTSRTVVDSVALNADVIFRVIDLTVDGIDLNLVGTCQTGAALRLRSKELIVDEPVGYSNEQGLSKLEMEFDPKVYQYGIQGGTLTGTLDIPAFSGCGTASGDDLSPLLTAALSGPGNPVSARVGATNCQIYDENYNARPIPPGVNNPKDPRAGCFVSWHPNPKIVTVPEPFEFPDQAPERQP